MANKKEIFSEVETIGDLIDKLIESEYMDSLYVNSDRSSKVFDSLKAVSEEEASKIIKYVHYVDKNMINKYNRDDSMDGKKIAAIIIGINCILSHSSMVKDYSFGALSLLSIHLNFADDTLYEDISNKLPHDALEYIVKRKRDYGYQYYFSMVVEKLSIEGKDSSYIVHYLSNHSDDELWSEGFDYNQDIMKDLMFINDTKNVETGGNHK